MPVPANDLSRIHRPLEAQLRERLGEVISSGELIMGPDVAAFERELAAACEVAHAVTVSSGTDALIAALMALDIGPGDEVVTTPFTFFATAGAIHRLGARPVFADIEPGSFNLSAEATEAAVTDRTRAILPVHLFGRCADLPALEAIAARHGVPLIEDAAQSVLARDGQGRMNGAVGRAGCLSFFPAKNLGALGDAGAVTTQDAELADRLRVLRVHGARPKYHHALVGGNFRLDTLQAAALRVKLPHLESWTAQREAAAERYRSLLVASGLAPEHIAVPEPGPGRHVYNQFVVRAKDRDGLRKHLDARGIATAVYYPVPLHLQACFAYLGHRTGDFPESERAAREVLALPIFPGIEPAEQEEVAQAIAAFYEAGRPAGG